jgi:diaminopimelate epimerase
MFPVRTPDGVRDVRVGDDVVSVDLGPVAAAEQITIDDRTYRRVIMGNPHAVTKVADPEEVDVATIGPRVEHHPAFPEGTNVEFISELRDGGIRMRVWERGVGETLACGSGIVAAAAVARGHDPQVHVWVPGGIATVTFEDDAAWLTGPARFVFEGESVSGPA